MPWLPRLLALLSLAGLCAVPAVSFLRADDQRTVLLPASGFGASLTAWDQVGDAAFALDEQVTREGRPSARIRIAPGATLAYQQLRRAFTRDIRQGDDLTASVWVRSEGVDQDPGAYLALEFVAADGSRAGIAHSRSSQDNGARAWERLEASGSAPVGTASVRLSLILHAHGTAWFSDPSLVRTARLTPWPDLGSRTRTITIDPAKVSQARFGGVGFHAFHHVFETTETDLNEVIYKRWREMNPSFARLNDLWDDAPEMRERAAEHMARMKATGTEIYLTSWNPPEVQSREEMQAWARRVADNLEFYVRRKGLTNVRTYCMTNELTLGRWGALVNDLPRFRDYHRALHAELGRRGLDVGLLATDASPVDYWHTIEWAAANMDNVTAAYGGHHYFNERGPDDERFYPWFASKLDWAVGIARDKGKPFILGEFGAKQDSRTLNGVRQDRCVYFETPDESMVTIQLAEAVIGALNAGVYGLGYWTYMDFPDEYRPNYINKWGTFRCSGADRSTRAIYYGYAPLTRFFRGPSTSYRVSADDPRLRAAAVQHHDSRSWSIAVVNRNDRAVPVRVSIVDGPDSARFRKYAYDPKAVRHSPFGDLPGPVATIAMRTGTMADTVGPMSLTVYTTAYSTRRPQPVRGVRIVREGDGNRVTWEPSDASDLCYYRVYRVEGRQRRQVRSTIATSIADDGPAGARYAVTAVDQSGNESALR